MSLDRLARKGLGAGAAHAALPSARCSVFLMLLVFAWNSGWVPAGRSWSRALHGSGVPAGGAPLSETFRRQRRCWGKVPSSPCLNILREVVTAMVKNRVHGDKPGSTHSFIGAQTLESAIQRRLAGGGELRQVLT